jgi:hypothetical protein
MDVTGKTYDEILHLTRSITAGGGTSIGCGLMAMAERNVEVDGIAVVSDGEENAPPVFAHAYKAYSQAFGKEVPVYLYETAGGRNVFTSNCKMLDIDVQEFNLRNGVDYHSLPNIVKTMRTRKYSLVDEILATKLVRLEDIFAGKEEAVYVAH